MHASNKQLRASESDRPRLSGTAPGKSQACCWGPEVTWLEGLFCSSDHHVFFLFFVFFVVCFFVFFGVFFCFYICCFTYSLTCLIVCLFGCLSRCFLKIWYKFVLLISIWRLFALPAKYVQIQLYDSGDTPRPRVLDSLLSVHNSMHCTILVESTIALFFFHWLYWIHYNIFIIWS